MKSFIKKYEGRELEILNYINEECGGDKYGNKVMEHFEAKDYIAWRKYVDKIARELDFKFVEKARCSIAENLLAPDVQLTLECEELSPLLRAEAKLKARIERQKARIEKARERYYLSLLAWNVEGDSQEADLRL